MKVIQEYDAYKFWKFISNKMTFKEFKELLLKNGHVIISIETEASLRSLQ